MNILDQQLNSTDPRKQLGEYIVRARAARDISHRDVARMCGVSVDVAKKFDTGEVVPNGEQWARLKGMTRQLGAVNPLWRHALKAQVAELPQVRRAGEIVSNQDRQLTIDSIMRTELDTNEQQSPAIDSTVDAPPALPDPRTARTFAEALRMVRTMEGLSQQDLADLLSLAPSAIVSWEKQRAVPVRDNWNKLVELLPVLRECKQPESRDIEKPVGQSINQSYRAPLKFEDSDTNYILIPPEVPPQVPATPQRPSSERTLAQVASDYTEALAHGARTKRALDDARALLVTVEAAHTLAERAVGEAHAALVEMATKL